MAQTFIITLTTAGVDTGPFNLYSNTDGFTVPFEIAIAKEDLEAGYTSTLVPDTADTIRVKSENPICNNYIDLTTPTNITSTSESDGVVTASYTPLLDEENKPPEIEDVSISASGPLENGTILTATPTVIINGPFSIGVNQFQWYRAGGQQVSSITAISGATSNQYTLVDDDIGNHIICGVKGVQVGGVNNISEEFFSDMTDRVEWAGDGDIVADWEDFFEIESGVSVPDNWNDAGVNPNLVNFGTNPDWTAQDATKPLHDIDKLVFVAANSNHVLNNNDASSPAIFETWFKIKFNAVNGAAMGKGNNVLLGQDSAGLWRVGNNTGSIQGDLLEHVIRIRHDGASSILQIDNGVENTFTDNMGTSDGLQFGGLLTSFFGSFDLKRFQRTADGVLLTSQQVSDKWIFHGY